MVYPQCLLFSSSAIDEITFDNETMAIKFKGKNSKVYRYLIDEHFLNEVILTDCSVGEVFNRYKPSLLIQ